MTESGVDISKWQGSVDWAEAKTQLGFAMVKATQGVAEVDPDYAPNIAALREVGEHRGSYHYSDGGDAAAEAEFYVQHAGRQNGEMQALDFEGAVLENPDPVGWAAAWLAKVIELTGNRPLIYMSGSTVTRFDWARVVALNVGLWCASWGGTPDHGQWPFAIMWQRDDNGRLAGIGGNVDQDVFYGDASVWARYANNFEPPAIAHPAPAPAPAPLPAPHPQPAPAPAPVPGTAVYTVKAGDTLTAIAAEHGMSIAQLVHANEHAYPSLAWNENLIQIGWRLLVPNRVPAPAHPVSQPATHTVVAGDTLSSIAGTYHTSVAELVTLNAGHYPTLPHDPNLIDIGWTLRVA
jgi:GH25 family lysozyme M1 (1,4-beta-N-acetylmuramidase)/LysM repeat protein